MNKLKKIPRTCKLYISIILIVVSLVVSSTRRTYNCSSGTVDLGGDWNPSGLGVMSSTILFGSEHTGNWDIYRINTDGSNQINLTNTEGDDHSYVFSPNGSKIAFVSNRSGNSEVYSMGADGSNQTNLTNSPGEDLHPSWSPDGSKIVWAGSLDT